MKRPLLITDCDEVLLHMVAPFGQWLDEAHDIDLVLVMSVNPGFGGQKFLPVVADKIANLRRMFAEAGRSNKDVHISVDGGINVETGRQVVEKGASALVAGNYIYKAPDIKKAVKDLKDLKVLSNVKVEASR